MSMIDEHGRALLSQARSPSPSGAKSHRSAESAQAGKLWEALFAARTGHSARNLADLEDAVFRFYLPMARTLAHQFADGPQGFTTAEQAAELGLAQLFLPGGIATAANSDGSRRPRFRCS